MNEASSIPRKILTFFAALLLAGAIPLIAHSSAHATESDNETPYAILYDDGTLVLQKGKETANEKEVLSFVEIIGGDAYDYRWRTPLLSTETDPSVVQKVIVKDELSPSTVANWFYSMSNLTEIEGISKIDTSNVVTMEGTFYDCASLQELDLSSFDTSKVTSLNNMFDGCRSLITLDLSNFNAANVEAMRYTFNDCQSLASLLLPISGTPKLRSTYMMFGSVTKVGVAPRSARAVADCPSRSGTSPENPILHYRQAALLSHPSSARTTVIMRAACSAAVPS